MAMNAFLPIVGTGREIKAILSVNDPLSFFVTAGRKSLENSFRGYRRISKTL